MTTVNDLGFSGLKKGMKFKSHSINDTAIYEITSDELYSLCGPYYEVIVSDPNTLKYDTTWSKAEIESTCFIIRDYILIENDTDKLYQEKVPEYKSPCYHYNKKKVLLFTSGYWYCPDCQSDLGTLTEDEFKEAVKEEFGGKPCKPAPEMNRWKKRK